MKTKIIITSLICSSIAVAMCDKGYCGSGYKNLKKTSSVVVPSQESTRKTTFKDAVAAAMKNSSSYAISKIDNVSARLSKTNAYAVLAPNIELVASATKSSSNSSYTNPMRDRISGESSENSGTVTVEGVLTQNLFHSFTTTNNYKSKKAAATAAEWKLESDTANLIYSVAESLTNLWYTHEDYKSAKMKMENLAKELEAQNSSFAAGAATKYDVAKAKANYEQSIYEAKLAELNIISAAAEFTRITGLTPTDNIELPNLDGISLPQNQAELEKIALKNNPGILQAKFLEQAACYDLKSTKGRLGPRVDFTARANMSHVVNNMNDWESYKRNGGSIAVQLTMPILSSSESSGNTYCAISMANEAAKKAAYQVKDTMNTIKKECRVSFNNYESAISMIKASESAVTSAKVGADGDRQESALGLKSNTETLVRENQMYDSRKSLARSRAQFVLAKAAMLRLMGKLNTKFLKL